MCFEMVETLQGDIAGKFTTTYQGIVMIIKMYSDQAYFSFT